MSVKRGFRLLLITFVSLAPAGVALAASPEDVLRPVLNDPRLEDYRAAVNLAADAQSKNPIAKAELKLGRGEWEKNDIKYGFRVYPKGISEYGAASRFQEALVQNEKAAQAEGVSLLLAQRYQLLARMTNLKERKKIADEVSSLVKKASRALSVAAQKDRAELKSFLKTKTDLDKLSIKFADVDRDFVNLELEMKDLKLASLESYDLSELAEMADLRRRLDEIAAAGASGPQGKILSVALAEKEIQKIRAESEYGRARADKWIDHIELSLKEEKAEKIYGVELSLNLPFLGAPDVSRAEKEARARREEAKAVDTIQTMDRETKNVLGELRTLLGLHQSLAESQSRLTPEQMKKASRAISVQDPLLAVEMQRGWFEGREQVLDLEFRIRTLYITYLHEMAVIANSPSVNHLSKSLRSF
ncbi:MAG: hypothetical protein KF789_09295 [Bdellovibrionaceae bacterium]|nr:hypothetical protein [Pseudobdellovibrionaceae bacterium]